MLENKHNTMALYKTEIDKHYFHEIAKGEEVIIVDDRVKGVVTDIGTKHNPEKQRGKAKFESFEQKEVTLKTESGRVVKVTEPVFMVKKK